LGEYPELKGLLDYSESVSASVSAAVGEKGGAGGAGGEEGVLRLVLDQYMKCPEETASQVGVICITIIDTIILHIHTNDAYYSIHIHLSAALRPSNAPRGQRMQVYYHILSIILSYYRNLILSYYHTITLLYSHTIILSY
jgi:hypothetical protein